MREELVVRIMLPLGRTTARSSQGLRGGAQRAHRQQWKNPAVSSKFFPLAVNNSTNSTLQSTRLYKSWYALPRPCWCPHDVQKLTKTVYWCSSTSTSSSWMCR